MSINSKKKTPSLFSWQAIISTGLYKRLLITLGILSLYRLGIQIPLPDIDHAVFQAHSNMLSSGILGMVDMFAGGALSALSIFALGIGPFITASIMMQLLGEIFPNLKDLQREQGEEGRRQYQQWTRRLTLLLAIMQSFALAKYIHFQGMQVFAQTAAAGAPERLILSDLPAWLFIGKIVLIMATGSMFVMWLGELISEFGIGNGGSLLIFAGIAARLPKMILQTYEAYNIGSIPTWGIIVLLISLVLIIAAIIALQEAVRKLLIIGAQANHGREVSATTHGEHYLPLKVNPAGVLPIIFASMTMFIPFQLLNFVDQGQTASLSTRLHDILSGNGLTKGLIAFFDNNEFWSGIWSSIGMFFDKLFTYYTPEHSLLYFLLILVFAYFYASILLPAREIAENLQKSGTAIQGVKPGKPTGEFLEALINRLVLLGGSAIALITIAPIHIEKFTQVTTLGGLGSTSLIIMVGVAIDLYNQITSYLQSHQYNVRSLLN